MKSFTILRYSLSYTQWKSEVEKEVSAKNLHLLNLSPMF